MGRALTQNYVLEDLHLDGEDRFRFMATDPDGLTGDAPEPALADIQRLYDRTAHLEAQLHDLNWSSRFRINSRHMTTLRERRVFFGGDAAHVHSPAGGQGMNAGIQDMVNLGWKLAMVLRGVARPELLDTYSSDRLPVIRQLMAMTERATRVFNSTSPLAHELLTRLAPKLLSQSRIQDKAAARLGQLTVSYRGAPLSAGGGRTGRLRAGDRVPDLALAEGRLYDLLDLSTPTLFVVGAPGPVTSAQTASEPIARVYRRWGDVIAVRIAVRHLSSATDLAPAPAWPLVRLDGQLAAAGGPGDGARLSRWLNRWLVSPERATPPSAPSDSGAAATIGGAGPIPK